MIFISNLIVVAFIGLSCAISYELSIQKKENKGHELGIKVIAIIVFVIFSAIALSLIN